jgi:hypothetical protein
MDWHTKIFHFNVLQKVTSKCEKFTSKNIINENKDYHLNELCIKFFECDQYLGNAQDVKNSKVLFIGTRSFMQIAKKGNAFLIYVFPTSDIKLLCHEIPSQYKEFKDVFEKKNIDTLPKHRPYDCTIDFEGSQLPFGLIHNLSHYKIATFHEYIDENLEKGFI